MQTIEAEIIAHSKNQFGDELVTYLVTFPRIILPEVLTHRMFSRNTSSSRAIPISKMIEAVSENPFIPIAWQKPHKGMQGTEYRDIASELSLRAEWSLNADKTVKLARELTDLGCTKQLANRIIEPYAWCRMIITTGIDGLNNFFSLRCPKYTFNDGSSSYVFKSKSEAIKAGYSPEIDMRYTEVVNWLLVNKSTAEIHIQALSELMYDAYIKSKESVKESEYHIPFYNEIISNYGNLDIDDIIKVSTSMIARTSYTLIENAKPITVEKHKELFKLLINERHDSPLEHCAISIPDKQYSKYVKVCSKQSEVIELGWCGNFKGFKSLRFMIESGNFQY